MMNPDIHRQFSSYTQHLYGKVDEKDSHLYGKVCETGFHLYGKVCERGLCSYLMLTFDFLRFLLQLLHVDFKIVFELKKNSYFL